MPRPKQPDLVIIGEGTMVTNPTSCSVMVEDPAQVDSFVITCYELTSEPPVATLEVEKPAGGNPISFSLEELDIPEESHDKELSFWVASKNEFGTSSAKEAEQTFKVTSSNSAPARPMQVELT